MDLAPWFCCGSAPSALTMDSPAFALLTVISCFSPDSPPPLNTPSFSPPQCLSLAVPLQPLSSVFCHVPLLFILAYFNFLTLQLRWCVWRPGGGGCSAVLHINVLQQQEAGLCWLLVVQPRCVAACNGSCMVPRCSIGGKKQHKRSLQCVYVRRWEWGVKNACIFTITPHPLSTPRSPHCDKLRGGMMRALYSFHPFMGQSWQSRHVLSFSKCPHWADAGGGGSLSPHERLFSKRIPNWFNEATTGAINYFEGKTMKRSFMCIFVSSCVQNCVLMCTKRWMFSTYLLHVALRHTLKQFSVINGLFLSHDACWEMLCFWTGWKDEFVDTIAACDFIRKLWVSLKGNERWVINKSWQLQLTIFNTKRC